MERGSDPIGPNTRTDVQSRQISNNRAPHPNLAHVAGTMQQPENTAMTRAANAPPRSFPLDSCASAFAQQALERLAEKGLDGRRGTAPELQTLVEQVGNGDSAAGWALLDQMPEAQFTPLLQQAERTMIARWRDELENARRESRSILPPGAVTAAMGQSALNTFQHHADIALVSNGEGNAPPAVRNVPSSVDRLIARSNDPSIVQSDSPPRRFEHALRDPNVPMPPSSRPVATLRALRALQACMDGCDEELMNEENRAFFDAMKATLKADKALALNQRDQLGWMSSAADFLKKLEETLASMGEFLTGAPHMGPWTKRTDEAMADLKHAMAQLQADNSARGSNGGGGGGGGGGAMAAHQPASADQPAPVHHVSWADQMDEGEGEEPKDDLPPSSEWCFTKPDHEMPPGLGLALVTGHWQVWTGKAYVPYNQWLREVTGSPNEAAIQTTATPAKVRMPPPAPFSGEGNEVDPELALMGLENYFTSLGLASSEWGRQVQTLLRGAALKAYSALALPLHSTGQAPKWQQVRSLMLSFTRRDTPTLARAKLASIRQMGTVAEFNNTFRLLLTQVGADPPAPTDLMHYYLNGLKSPSRLSPWGTAWSSLEDAQTFHLTRELADLKIPATERHRNPFKPSFKPRLNAIAPTQGTKRTAATFGERSVGGRGDKGGRGGRDNSFAARNTGSGGRSPGGRGSGNGGRGSPGAGPSNPLRCFGNTLEEITTNVEGPCPLHTGPTYTGTPHTKGSCGRFKDAASAFILSISK